MKPSRIVLIALLAAAAASPTPAAERTLTLSDFETDADVRAWEIRSGGANLVGEGATHGRKALELKFDPKGRYHPAYMFWHKVRRDWSAYDALVLDVFNPTDAPVSGYVLIADQAWRDKGGTYWNRHNASTPFGPGRTRWVIPVGGLYRGEAGSRNNDIRRNIDPDKIVRVDFGFGRRGETGRIVIDHLRLVKADRPAGVWAFDFGPPSQPVMLGWTGVSNKTRFTKQRGFGWVHLPHTGAARDTTFGSTLLRDFCEARLYPFRIAAPAGRYRVTVFYENCGYWGGEQACQSWRTIAVNGRQVWKQTRPDGSAHALLRFEDVEPVGVDLWKTYMAPELARPVVFEAAAAGDGLLFRFDADRPWGSKVAAIAVHRADDLAAKKWLDGQLAAVAEEFRGKAVCLDRPAAKWAAPDAWKPAGLVAWPVRIEQTVVPHSVPPAGAAAPDKLALSRLAVRGEHEPLCLAVRPLRDLGTCRLKLEPFAGPGKIDADVRVVWYNTQRGFNSISYRIGPHTLREASSVRLAAGVTRQIVVTCRVPPDAAAGTYRGALTVEGGGKALLRVPLTLDVRSVTLERDTAYLMGFFGLTPSRLVPDEKRWETLEETLRLLKAHGMNAVSGGPSWKLTGWEDGQPVIDYGECDRFFALLRKHGFTKGLNGYGGMRFRGLHDRYSKGRSGAAVEKASGLSYEQAVLRAWKTLDAHARGANWPVIFYAMCDETRVRDRAERELAFMKLMAKVSKAFPRTVRTSGSYSVNFNTRPTDKNDLLYWHQRFFEALDVNSLNRHGPDVMAEARKLGKDIHIYNQGRTRYSFGLYQWSEHRKGVAARWQWHLNILHGYQFFDLDGREPDTAMICYGRKGIYPTIHFERCREGAEDFYLYQTLWNLLARRKAGGKQTDADRRGRALLAGQTDRVRLNQRTPPSGFDADAFKAQVVAAIERLAGSGG